MTMMPSQVEAGLHVEKTIDIDAPLQVTFDAMLDELGPEGQAPDGKPMPMVLEAWPGGRWYRDLGDNAGHFWGHVQVIKPPTLLEITGPLFMSYAAISHVRYRLAEHNGGTRLTLTHRAIGDIDPDHRAGVGTGWGHYLGRIKTLAERKK